MFLYTTIGSGEGWWVPFLTKKRPKGMSYISIKVDFSSSFVHVDEDREWNVVGKIKENLLVFFRKMKTDPETNLL